MDLIPKPGQLVSAAGNIAQTVLYGGLADLRPMPRTLIDDGTLREVYHYRPQAGVGQHGDPVLLVAPLAAPALCFDLRRGCSLVEHLVSTGRPTYLVEYGEVSFRDRALGVEHWVREVLPAAIREASAHAGGRPVHVVGWSLGGIFSLLTAADQAGDLPIATLTLVGVPVDVTLVPLVAPFRPLMAIGPGSSVVTRLYRTLGGAPAPFVRWAFQLSSVQKVVTKPVALATHVDDADWLAQIEAVDRFMSKMTAYPGRTFGQIYHRFIKGNALAEGRFELDDHTIDVADIDVPVLVFAGATDSIAPVMAVRAVEPLLTGSPEVQFEIVPGGHLGMLTGRAARDTTWLALDDWMAQRSSAEKVAKTKTKTKKAKGSPGSKGSKGSAKAGATKGRAKGAAKADASGTAAGIGTSSERRHGSGSSRALAP